MQNEYARQFVALKMNWQAYLKFVVESVEFSLDYSSNSPSSDSRVSDFTFGGFINED